MKKLFFVILFSTNAFAVNTSQCPEQLNIQLSEIHPKFVEEYQYIEQYSRNFRYLNELKKLDLNVELTNNASGKCNYETTTNKEIKSSIQIYTNHGKDRMRINFENKAEQPHLVSAYSLAFGIDTLQPDGIIIETPENAVDLYTVLYNSVRPDSNFYAPIGNVKILVK